MRRDLRTSHALATLLRHVLTRDYGVEPDDMGGFPIDILPWYSTNRFTNADFSHDSLLRVVRDNDKQRFVLYRRADAPDPTRIMIAAVNGHSTATAQMYFRRARIVDDTVREGNACASLRCNCNAMERNATQRSNLKVNLSLNP